MNPAIQNNTFLVKEHVGMFKAANNYDIFDPQDGNLLMECREDSLGIFTKIFRFTKYKSMTPFDVKVSDTSGKQIVRVKRGLSLFLSQVQVFDENDQLVGSFKQKLFSIGGAFTVLDPSGQELCHLKGKWTGWDFRFMAEDIEFAHVTKQWAGIGKELFTSADNYILQITDAVEQNSHLRTLILGAVMCIDMVLKE